MNAIKSNVSEIYGGLEIAILDVVFYLSAPIDPFRIHNEKGVITKISFFVDYLDPIKDSKLSPGLIKHVIVLLFAFILVF